jgi:MFS transporter, DHA2 family, methylenomycin A resistance protein
VLVTLVTATLAATIWRVPGVPWFTAVALGGSALAAGAALRRHLLRAAAPILDLGLFARPGFMAAGVSILGSNLTMYTILLAIPVFLTEVVDWGARDIGTLLAGMSVPMLVFGPVGGWLSDRYGRRAPALAGTALAALGTLPLAAVSATWSWAAYGVPLVVVGAGIGLASAPVHAAAMQAARTGAAGQAAGLFSTMRYAGSILGTATMAAVLGAAPEVGTFRALFAALVAAALVAAAASARLPRGVAGSD